jgi:hypothetical protein
MLDAVTNQLRGDQTDVVEDRSGDVLGERPHQSPGLGGGLRSGGDISLNLHAPPPSGRCNGEATRLLLRLHDLYPGDTGGNRHVQEPLDLPGAVD